MVKVRNKKTKGFGENQKPKELKTWKVNSYIDQISNHTSEAVETKQVFFFPTSSEWINELIAAIEILYKDGTANNVIYIIGDINEVILDLFNHSLEFAKELLSVNIGRGFDLCILILPDTKTAREGLSYTEEEEK